MRVARGILINLTICLFLFAIVWFAFGRSLQNGFVNYDDSDYVFENPNITQGLSLGGIAWAFTHVHAANWHPITTISHMLDCQVYGLHPWGHHLTSILLHATTAILLFFALRELTGSRPPRDESVRLADRTGGIWPSAFVATLFAIHPLRVESVAWVSERKDVLSGVFFMLTLLAYARYVKKGDWFGWSYLLVVVCFVLGLLCKPTLVTLPCVLLLLDYWPLRRSHKAEVGGQRSGIRVWWPLINEKIPLFVLSASSCVATVVAQQKVIEANLRMNFIQRASNAATSYVAYLKEMIWPFHLVVSHPYAQGYRDLPGAIVAFAFLLFISALCLVWRKKYPFLLTGWFWYLGILVPMIGLVQVSAESRADRYTYLAQIGLYILLVWSTAKAINQRRLHPALVSIPALIVITALGFRSYDQTQYWRNSEALWRHALDSSTYDYIAHDSLGYTLLEQGKIDDAIGEYEKALQIKPDYAESHNNLGNALMLKGQTEKATAHYRKALELDPDASEVTNNLGNALLRAGQVDDAIKFYQQAVTKDPRTAEVQYNLGNALIVKGDWSEAALHLRVALKENPQYAQAHNKLGITFGATGQIGLAVKEFEEAVRLDPKYAQAHFNLGYILAHAGHRVEAISHLNEALRLNPNYMDAKEQLRQLGVDPGQ